MPKEWVKDDKHVKGTLMGRQELTGAAPTRLALAYSLEMAKEAALKPRPHKEVAPGLSPNLFMVALALGPVRIKKQISMNFRMRTFWLPKLESYPLVL